MKATAIRYFVREIYGNASEILNARQEISRGGEDYGVYWKFKLVTKEEFLKEIEEDKKVCCIETKSHKYIEVDKNNIDNYILSEGKLYPPCEEQYQ